MQRRGREVTKAGTGASGAGGSGAAAVYRTDGKLDRDGWVDIERRQGGRVVRARVRFLANAAGRLEPRELHLLDRGRELVPRELRTFNLGTVTAIVRAMQASPVRRRPLKPPAGHRYPDTFYDQVAARYNAAQRAGAGRRAPVQAIADEAAVPRTTAARWVKEARARGKLPAAPGQGKVSDA
jgi:hypothetical protein